MKRRIFVFSSIVALMTLTLTSCKVNWFDKQYDAPWWAVAIPVAIFTVAVVFGCAKYISSREFMCPKCNQKFHPKWWRAMLSVHINSDRVFKCPHCGKRSLCHIVRKNRENTEDEQK